MKRCGCLLIALLFAAGCGGGAGHGRLSKADYEAKLRSVFRVAASADTAAHHGVRDSPMLLREVAATYAGVATSLKGVRAPTDVQVLNDRLVAGASKEASTLDDLAAKLAAVSEAERVRLLAQFDATQTPGQDEFDRAVAALVAKGYRFKPNGGA